MDVGLELLHGQPAPVRVVAPLEVRLLVVLVGVDDLRDVRVAAVGADHDASALVDGLAVGVVTADPDDRAVLDDHVFDREALPHLGACCRRGVDEDLVEHGAARRVGDRVAVGRTSRAGDRERPEVEAVAVDRRATGRDDLVEHAPPLQRGDARRVDQVCRKGVARERRPIDDENLVALAGEQHCRRGAGAPGSDHDGVVGLCHVPHDGRSREHRGSGRSPIRRLISPERRRRRPRPGCAGRAWPGCFRRGARPSFG